MEDCDEDVIFEGSALYHHLVSSGYESEFEIFNKIPDKFETSESENNDSPSQELNPSKISTNIISGIPGINYESLVIEVAQQAIESKLLVDEDVDFLKNFLQLEVKAKKKAGLWFLVPVVAMVPLAFLSSSSVSRMFGMTGFALSVGLGCLQMKQVFRHNRIVKSHCNLLQSSARLKSILNEARLL